MGDCRQIGPVVKYGTMPDTINASLRQSYLWPKFQVFQFIENMRLTSLRGQANVSEEDIEQESRFARNLLTVGNGQHDGIDAILRDSDATKGSATLTLPLIQATADIDAALRFIHPHGFSGKNRHKRLILAGTNAAVSQWNDLIQTMNTNPAREYLSDNLWDACDDPHGYLQECLTDSLLNRYESSQIPPHKLVLKVGDICIVLRTLKLKQNVATNTMVIIETLRAKTIQVRLVNSDRLVDIPRIRFRCKLPYLKSFEIQRTQFPFRLAYALTFNKAQGQTLEKVLMDVRSPVFSHGFLYVGNSRVRNSKDLMYLTNASDIDQDGSPTTDNVVYHPLLLPSSEN